MGRVSGREEQAPTAAAVEELPKPVQTSEMVSGVPGAGGLVLEAHERLAFKQGHSLEVG